MRYIVIRSIHNPLGETMSWPIGDYDTKIGAKRRQQQSDTAAKPVLDAPGFAALGIAGVSHSVLEIPDGG